MEEETSSRRGGVVVVVVLSVVSNSPKKEMLESLLLSSVSPTKKKKRPLVSRFFSPASFRCSLRARGDIAFWFLFNRTRSARARRVAFFKMMDSRSLRMSFSCCLGFVSKKIREKNCLTLSSHAHSPARAQRERQTKRKKGRRETENRRSHTHRALFAFLFRDYIPFLLEWVIHAALVVHS